MLKFGTENSEITEKSPNAPFVISIDDNGNNELKIVLALPARGEAGEGIENIPNEKIKELLVGSYSVYEDMSRTYEIIFDNYIIYQCRNESYTCFDPEEIFTGKYLVVFESSPLLCYYENVIFDFDDDKTKAKRRHYGIFAENHIIDIIANEKPVIRKIQI